MINLCEKDLGAGSLASSVAAGDQDDFLSLISAARPAYTLDQVNYCVEMAEDIFKVKCVECNQVMTRAEYREHHPCSHQAA